VSRLLAGLSGGATYAGAGVSIENGDEAVERISAMVASTNRPEVLGGIGGFGGLFALDTARYQRPVLVSSADGVGTKLEIARLANRFDTVGIDLVAMLVDDLACVGAEPLFLLDYVAVGQLDPARLEELVSGIAVGARRAGAALVGGETAEHAGVMRPDDVDVAGFAVGVLERDSELGGHLVREGDAIVGFASPGLRSNGYSLARRVLVEGREDQLHQPAWAGADTTLLEEMLRPSVIYVPAITELRRVIGPDLHSVAHITGGGIVGNVPRALPDHLDAVIDMNSFVTPEIFFEIQRRGDVSAEEMVRVFNCGLGMTLCVDESSVNTVIDVAHAHGITATRVGHVTAGSRKVQLL